MSSTITAIVVQKKNKNRFSIFMDGDYAFSVSDKLAVSLHVGDCLTPERIDALKQADEEDRAFLRAIHYLKFRPRSRMEMQCYLSRKGFTETCISAVIARLESIGYINDRHFAAAWVDSRERNRPRGKFALQYELSQKGVAEEIIDGVLADYNEEAAAWRAAESRTESLKKHDARTMKIKLYDFLKRRGFTFETCGRIYSRMIEWPEKSDEP